MKYKFEFNHDERHFDKAFPSTIDPEKAIKDISKLKEDEHLKKTVGIEKILTLGNPQTPNDIFVLGLAFGSAYSMERLVNHISDSDRLPDPRIMRAMLDGLMEAAYGHGSEGKYGLDKEGFKEHIQEEKNDF